MSSILSNHLSQEERVVIGQQYERIILQMLNIHDIKFRGHTVDKWVAAEVQEDMVDKIDAWACMQDAKYSVQIKYREGGPDIGIAAVRPYYNHEVFRKWFEEDAVPLDRDFKKDVDLYACLSAGGSILTVVDGQIIKRGVRTLLARLYYSEGFSGNVFADDRCPGAELRLVKDKGQGYSLGQKKIICYFTPSILEKAGAYVWRSFDSQNYN